jgi:hypothetical protein
MAYREIPRDPIRDLGLGIVYGSAVGGNVASPVRDRPEDIESLSPTDPAGAERTARMLLQRAEHAFQNADVAVYRRVGHHPGGGLIAPWHPEAAAIDELHKLRSDLATVRAIVDSGPWPMALDEPLVGVRDRVEDILEAARRLGGVA